MVVKFFTFEQIHNKNNIGSTRLRVHNLIKHWPEASIYKFGEKPDVMIFQKVYELRDYHFIKNLDCIKILDMCDPDWTDFEFLIKDTVDAVDAVTCSSPNLMQFISQLTDKPVVLIKDRFDFDQLPTPTKLYRPSTNLVWFGYSHNAETLRQAIWSLEDSYKLDAEGNQLVDEVKPYRLTVISNDDPQAWHYATNPERFQLKYDFKKFDAKTIMKELNKFDAALLPPDTRAKGRFKSNNKTIQANLAGLPVVTTMEELRELADYKLRNQRAIDVQAEAAKEYNVMESVREMKELIEQINRTKLGINPSPGPNLTKGVDYGA